MNRQLRVQVILVLAITTLCIGTSLLLGQDVNWDLRNYHYYDGWAFATGVIDRDLWPAQQQSFANPILPTLAYFLIAHLPPWAAAAVLAALQGVNVVLLALIAGQIFPRGAPGDQATVRILSLLSAVLIGVTGPMMFAEWGTTFGDNLPSCLVLGGLAALGRYHRERTYRWVILAGAAAGCAAGIKLTNAIYLVGFAVSGWWLGGEIRRIALRLFLFGGSAILGLALTFGPWAWHLWRTKANPVFPYFNGLFRSPWRPPDSLRDERFLPHSLLDALSYPFQWAVGLHPTTEVGFRDARFAIAWLLVLVWFCVKPRSRRDMRAPVEYRWLGILAVFWAASFCVWIVMFAYQRYLIPLELLSGLIIVGAITSFADFRISPRARSVVIIAVVALLLATTRSDGWGRIAWGENWFDVRLTPDLQSEDEMFVILSGDPIAYVIPSFPASARFVRLDGNLALVEGTRMFAEAQSAIAQHRGPLASLGPSTISAEDVVLLARFGLRGAGGSCFVVTTRVEQLSICPLIHTVGPAATSGGD